MAAKGLRDGSEEARTMIVSNAECVAYSSGPRGCNTKRYIIKECDAGGQLK